MARVASRHLSGTLASRNHLLRFPVETTKRWAHVKRWIRVDTASAALSIACHREVSIFLRKEPAALTYFRWIRTLRRGDVLERGFTWIDWKPLIFFSFVSPLSHFSSCRVDMYFKMLVNASLNLRRQRGSGIFWVERDLRVLVAWSLLFRWWLWRYFWRSPDFSVKIVNTENSSRGDVD